ncbi:bile acid:sodium symporter family protein [Spongiibacter sp. KMU-166]|uniref:Bile acid:sodium symporter family protein n=1 Tax=Spongiibacter thalassae TaxID=2721624 RepID=A0ABX1GH75_9GAMM|nr:bile acid:sodium symporter family protein [Spongiibacter thalassae]NKI18550.1 bile acid:sodium symporter family protein [Spongiibacter thalassae]
MPTSAYSDINVAFSPTSLLLLNGILALMIFGVSIGLRKEDFLRILRQPRAPVAGLIAQFVLLPAASCAITIIFNIPAELALGMILIAACPGGSFSNIMTWLAKASLPVSISMTAVSSLAAMVMTPLNFALYAQINPSTRALMREISIDTGNLLLLVALVLLLPMLVGMALGQRKPELALRAEKPMRWVTLAVFLSFVVIAFQRNQALFMEYADRILLLVVAQNLIALLLGNLAGRACRLPRNERRAVTMEIGIQNSALALSIIFTFFPQAGGMMLIAGFWSFWHLFSGLLLALYWSKTAEDTP